MPIPEQSTPWLPEPWDVAYEQYEINDAWYTGDTKRLADIYQRGSREAATHTRRGQNMRGGLVGAATRMFWGRQVPVAENRARIHVPAPADLATLASDQVFSEGMEVTLPKLEEKTKARLDLIANSDEALETFSTMGELKSAFGATALVTRWDKAVSDNAWLEAVAADVVIPTFQSGRLIELTLWTEYTHDNVRWRHLEHHAPGYIEHALFEGTPDNLGRRVPLDARPETAHLAGLVNAQSVIVTGIDRLTASWNPNMNAVQWRKKGVLANAGRSDFHQLLPLFDTLDETFSSWVRDLRLGAGRVIVPEAALDVAGPGQGGSFDMGREVFAGLNMPGDPSKMTFDKVQFDIRVEEHEKTMLAIYREILRKAGFSPSAWGDYSGGSQMTAAEIQDRKSASERTRDKKILRDRAAISQQSSVALEIDGLLFPGKGGKRLDVLPSVSFPDVSQAGPEQLAQTLSLLDTAGAISLEQKVRRANPDWDDDAVKTEVDAIRSERAVADPTTFTGLD